MPRDVVALVSADDFVSAVRVYADRVNDLLRRSRVPALEAIEIAETNALSLLDAVINAPTTVIDLAGWWFARAIEATTRDGRAVVIAPVDEPISMLAGTSGESQVRAALAGLPEPERAAVLLRDGYDLPAQAVGVALRRGGGPAAELTAAGRLHLVAAYDSRQAPNLSGHTGRTTVDVVALSQLADGTLESPRATSLTRHVGTCAACEDMLETLSKGRRLAAGLPIIAMDDDAREALIHRVSRRAVATLPSHDEVLRAVDEDTDPGPVVSPVLVIAVLVLALVLGVVLAAVIRSNSSTATTPPPPLPTGAAGNVTPSFAVSPAISTPPAATGSSPPGSPGHSSPPLTPSSPTTTGAALQVAPSAGNHGTIFTVSGAGFPPGSTVALAYAGHQSTSNAVVRENGSFTTQLLADAKVPGTHTITATDGAVTAKVVFDQRS